MSVKILVSGSLAYDYIMDFPGYFKDHILSNKIHILNVSFAVNNLKQNFGGAAGNIAYNLSLLNEKPIVLGTVGNDFSQYAQWMKKNKINISKIRKIKNQFTSRAYIITDIADNQITGFYDILQKEQNNNEKNKIRRRVSEKIIKINPKLFSFFQQISLNSRVYAIIAPEFKKNMIEYAKIYKKLKIPYIFDPGQQITNLTSFELKQAIIGSKILIGNDYEIQLILNKLKIDQKALEKLTEILIITKGSKGSVIYNNNQKINIPPVKPKRILDPTGAGDAYRAGIIKGLIENWPLKKAGMLASKIAAKAVEKIGTQKHHY